MPRLRASFALLALLAPLYLKGQSDPAPWRFVYPNAKALISIDWQRIRQTPAGINLRDKWLHAGLGASIPGSGLLDQVDRVVISSPGKAASDAAAAADTTANPAEAPMLIAVEGRFDAAQVRRVFARLGSKPQAYNSYQVYRPQGRGAKDIAYVLVDAGTILFGDAPSVFAALDRNRFPASAPEPGSIVARGAELDANYELWAVFTSPNLLTNDRLSDLFGGDDWAADAQGFEAGISLRAGFTADVTVRCASEAAAKQMAAAMRRLISIVSKDKDDPRMQSIARKLKFTSEGPAAKINLRLTPQELAANVEAFAAAHPAPTPQKPVLSTATPATPAKPGVIRIEGLDDGPREIPFPDHQN